MNEKEVQPELNEKTGHPQLTDLENEYWKHVFTQKEQGVPYQDAQKTFDLGIPPRLRGAQDYDGLEAFVRHAEEKAEQVFKTSNGSSFIRESTLYALMHNAENREELRYFLNQIEMSNVRRQSLLNAMRPSEYGLGDLAKDAATGKLVNISNPAFVQDFAEMAKDAVLGLRHLPGLGWNLGKEILKDGDYVLEFLDVKNIKEWEAYQKKYPTIAGIMEDTYMRFSSPERIKKTFEENQWSIPADMLPSMSKFARASGHSKLARALEIVNPGDLPTEALGFAAKRGLKGLSEITQRSRRRDIDPEMEIRTGQSGSGEMDVHTKKVSEMADELGLQTSDVPPSVRTDSKPILAKEAWYLKTEESNVTRRLQEMDAKTQGAIETSQRRLANEQGVSDAFQTSDVGHKFYEHFNEHQAKLSKEIGDDYNKAANDILEKPLGVSPIGDAADEWIISDTIPLTNALLESRKKNVVQKDLEKVKGILDAIFEESLFEKVQDIKDLRTEFRRRINNEYRTGGISEIGSGTIEAQVYSSLTKDLHEYIKRAGGDAALQQVKAIDKKYATIKEQQLETDAGKLLFDKDNIRNPERLVNKLIDGVLGETDIDLFYDMIGENDKVTIRAGIVAQIFNRSLKDKEWTPMGLSKTLNGITGGKRSKNYLKLLLGNDQFAEGLTLKLYEFAEFSKRLQRVRTVTGGSQTAFLLHAAGIGGALSLNSSDLFHIWGMGGDMLESAIGYTAGMAGAKLIDKSLEFTKKALGDKKFMELINDKTTVEMFLGGLSAETGQKAADWIAAQRTKAQVLGNIAREQEREREREKKRRLRRNKAASRKIPVE